MKEKINSIIDSIYTDILNIRRHIHQYPELSFDERNTSSYIKAILDSWNISYSSIVKNGIVVKIKGNNYNTKTIALRADIDALPINEENEISYSSNFKNVMHACGHDAHTAMLLGVIKILNQLKNEWDGTVKFIFQPAEEVFPGGAKPMIDSGVLKNPNVDKIFAQHVYPELEVGKVGFCDGWYMASADELNISIKGKGGHAALPQTYNNPIIASSYLITKLDNIFSKYKSKPSVLAIGYVEAKGYTNVIPDFVDLKGTFRTLDSDFRTFAHSLIKDTIFNTEKKYNVKIDFDLKIGYPPLYNDPNLTSNAISIAKEFLGDDNVVDLSYRMTAEDFAYFGKYVPACFYRLGVGNKAKGITHGLHTSKFNIDEGALKIGMGIMAYLAIKS